MALLAGSSYQDLVTDAAGGAKEPFDNLCFL